MADVLQAPQSHGSSTSNHLRHTCDNSRHACRRDCIWLCRMYEKLLASITYHPLMNFLAATGGGSAAAATPSDNAQLISWLSDSTAVCLLFPFCLYSLDLLALSSVPLFLPRPMTSPATVSRHCPCFGYKIKYCLSDGTTTGAICKPWTCTNGNQPQYAIDNGNWCSDS
jgi:hypothetical protein